MPSCPLQNYLLNVQHQIHNCITVSERVNPAFYNAFYELFDEGRYVDTNYDVNLGQAIFLLTCNFGSEEEIKKILGPAMFSRIGCCIAYEELSTEQKQTIVHNWYESILSVLKADEKEEIEKTDILDWFIESIIKGWINFIKLIN